MPRQPRKPLNPDNILVQLVTTALQYGADALNVEYKDGHEEVDAMKGDLGIGIACWESESEQAESLVAQLAAAKKRATTVEIEGETYRFRKLQQLWSLQVFNVP